MTEAAYPRHAWGGRMAELPAKLYEPSSARREEVKDIRDNRDPASMNGEVDRQLAEIRAASNGRAKKFTGHRLTLDGRTLLFYHQQLATKAEMKVRAAK